MSDSLVMRAVEIAVIAAGVMVLAVMLGRAPQRVMQAEHIAAAGHTQTLHNTRAEASTSTHYSTRTDVVDSHPPAVLRWDAENVDYWMKQLGAPLSFRDYGGLTNDLVETAVRHGMACPTSIIEFAHALYFMPLTKDRLVGTSQILISRATNQVLAPLLIDLFTNDYGRYHVLPESDIKYSRTHDLTDALRGIGTPHVIEQLNQAWAELNKGEPWRSPPGETISPDRYPQEAREWLFTHWSPAVREAMVSRWLKSERPDTPEVLRLYIKKLEATALDDPYWGPTNAAVRDPFGRLPAARAYEKQAHIAEVRDWTEHYARKYRRWLKDKQRMPLHYGCYRDGNWDEYRRLSEADRQRRYGKQYGSKVMYE